MLPLTFGAGGLAALVLGSVLACGPGAADEGKSTPADAAKQKKRSAEIEKAIYDLLRAGLPLDLRKELFRAEIEKAIYDLLREDGVLRFPKCPWEIYVKRVEGRKLIDMEFKRRDKTGQYYDVVARAREGELRVNLPTRQLLVHMRHCFVAGGAEGAGIIEDKVWPIDLSDFPAELRK
jgi:hypothetical protein